MGYVGTNPTLNTADDGLEYTYFDVATRDVYDCRPTRAKATWHRVRLFGSKAVAACKYLKRGNPVYLEGRLKYTEFVDHQGRKHKSVVIHDPMMRFIDRDKKNKTV